MSAIRVSGLHRHPVKGLTPEPIALARLEAGGHFPGDRLYAIENGPSGFDPAAPEHLPKLKFLMLMRQERLAKLETRFDEATRRLEIRQGGGLAAAGHLESPEGRAAIERFLTSFLGEEALRGPLRLIGAPAGYRFMDSKSGFVSLLNLASVAAIARTIGRAQLDAHRFRANLHFEGLREWAEFELVGRRLRIGEAELEITKRIDRCAAIDVAPGAGLRDTRLVETLERSFGHHDCGVYATVIRTGDVRVGDEARLV